MLDANDTHVYEAIGCYKNISEFLGKIVPNKQIKSTKDERAELVATTKSMVEYHIKRSIIITSTCYFEEAIKEVITKIFEPCDSTIAKKLSENMLGKNKLFSLVSDPSNKSVNKFFKKFGEDFCEWYKWWRGEEKKKAGNKEIPIDKYIRKFCYLNGIRNRVAHGKFADLEGEINSKTSESICKDFEEASKFINWLPEALEKSEIWRKEKERRINNS